MTPCCGIPLSVTCGVHVLIYYRCMSMHQAVEGHDAAAHSSLTLCPLLMHVRTFVCKMVGSVQMPCADFR